jgi:tetratricopeptide (TPR) repeat protein
MDLTYLIKHPEQMDKETLYDLRSLLALHPYYQTARLLMLRNLYLLHDATFDEELRRAAVYITDRRVLFNLVEAAHYQLRTKAKAKQAEAKPSPSRTVALIDSFLESIPDEDDTDGKKKRKPTPADAAVDYVSYLLETESIGEHESEELATPQMKGQNLIDDFINNGNGKIQLKEEPEFLPQIEEEQDAEQHEDNEGYFTETLAKIYIKQGRYEKALEIIRRLNLNYPKKNAYFADQIRFLEKLILNNKTNKKTK